MQQVTAIVPAFNEEKTIGAVVHALVSSGCFHSVVVVSDGSTDQTAVVAREHGADVIVLEKNVGKGAALLHGVKQTSAPILFFADADLFGFSHDHISSLLTPIIEQGAAMTVGLRDRGEFALKIGKFLPLIGGERALRREVICHIPDHFLSGYAVEAAMNYHCKIRGWPYECVPLRGVHLRTKIQKVGWVRGLPQYMRMGFQVLSAMLRVRFAHIFQKKFVDHTKNIVSVY